MSEDANHRKPRSFRVEQSPAQAQPDASAREGAAAPRKPRAIRPGPALEMEVDDFFDREAMTADRAVIEDVDKRGGLSLGSLALGAAGLLASLAFGLWVDNVIRALFERAPWLGWGSLGLAGLMAVAVLLIVVREIAAILRLRSVDHLREELTAALAGSDSKRLTRATRELVRHMAANPKTAAGRTVLRAQHGEILDAADYYALAECELFRRLDREASLLVMGASKRVSVVTAVSPRAFLDMAYVVYENFRLVRRMSELYGGRTGAIGSVRLLRKVVAHLAVTGVASVSDGLVQQVIGHGVASRLSARLGEGVLNGLMTARVGLAAMEVCRPAPFHAVARPKLSAILATLTTAREDGHKRADDLL